MAACTGSLAMRLGHNASGLPGPDPGQLASHNASLNCTYSNYSSGNATDSPGDGGNVTVATNGTTAVGAGMEMVLQPYSMTHLLTTSIILGTIILATIIGNVFVIAAVILERNLHNVANYLVASLAVADLMVASLVMPLAAVNEVSTQWFLGSEVCDMWISFDVLCCTSSILHLVAIALDRYWAVTQVDYIHNRTARRILIMIALSWAISACISIPPLFGWRDTGTSTDDQQGVCLISQNWGYTVYSTVGAFYLPLIVIMIIYLKIFRAARSTIRKKHFKHAKHDATSGTTTNNVTPKPLLSTTMTDGPSVTIDGPSVTVMQSNASQSPDPSSNGSATGLNDANRNTTKHLHISPPGSPSSPLRSTPNHSPTDRSSWLDLTKMYLEGKRTPGHQHHHHHQQQQQHQHHASSPKAKRKKERIEQKRERKAARTLAIITGSFICCWLPFFILAIVRPFCGTQCQYPELLVGILGWLGYFNSLLNPIIYTIFNPDFRNAFRKILFGKYHNRYRGGRR